GALKGLIRGASLSALAPPGGPCHHRERGTAMGAKPSLILGASLVASCLVLGLYFGQPSAGQAPAAPARAEGRYQVVPFNSNNNFIVVVFDPATGRCWMREVDSTPKEWYDMGTPLKKE